MNECVSLFQIKVKKVSLNYTWASRDNFPRDLAKNNGIIES